MDSMWTAGGGLQKWLSLNLLSQIGLKKRFGFFYLWTSVYFHEHVVKPKSFLQFFSFLFVFFFCKVLFGEFFFYTCMSFWQVTSFKLNLIILETTDGGACLYTSTSMNPDWTQTLKEVFILIWSSIVFHLNLIISSFFILNSHRPCTGGSMTRSITVPWSLQSTVWQQVCVKRLI